MLMRNSKSKNDQHCVEMDASIYQHLFEVGKRLLAESEIDSLLTRAMDDAIEISCAERGMIILFDKYGNIIFKQQEISIKWILKNQSLKSAEPLSMACGAKGKRAIFKMHWKIND